jgi:hypothetical protein
MQLFKLFKIFGIYDFAPVPYNLAFFLAKHFFPLNKAALFYLADSNFD